MSKFVDRGLSMQRSPKDLRLFNDLTIAFAVEDHLESTFLFQTPICRTIHQQIYRFLFLSFSLDWAKATDRLLIAHCAQLNKKLAFSF